MRIHRALWTAGVAASVYGCIPREPPGGSSRLDDDGVVATSKDLSVRVEPTMHPRTTLVGPSKTALVWFSHVETSAAVASVEPHREEGAPIATAANVGNDGETDGFELELHDEDLRRALRGVPVAVRVELESGESVDVSFDLGVVLVDRAPAFPILLSPTLRPTGGADLAFEATLAGPPMTDVEVEAAVVPMVSTDSGLWRFRWSVDDALTSSMWRNGAVTIHALGQSGVALDAHATVSPAIVRARLDPAPSP